MIYSLCDGDITKKKEIMKLTHEEITVWFCLNGYEAWKDEQIRKQMEREHARR